MADEGDRGSRYSRIRRAASGSAAIQNVTSGKQEVVERRLITADNFNSPPRRLDLTYIPIHPANLMAFLAKLKSLSCLGTKPSHRQEAGHAANSNETKHAPEPAEPAELDGDVFLPPLRPVTFPKVLPIHQPALADQGWTTITYSDPDPLYTRSQSLLAASKAFFDRPADYKEGFKTSGGSAEGWSLVEGEKEFITLRSTDKLPDELRDSVIAFWAEAGGLLDVILGRVAMSLGLPAEELTAFSSPCKVMGRRRTQTMMRLFRYEGFEDMQSKIVAEGKPSVPVAV